MNSSSPLPDPQSPLPPNSSASNSGSGKQDAYNPHEANLTRRDVTFICYMAALGVVPFIVALVMCYVLYAYNPNFDSFPKGAAPMGPVEENRRVKLSEESTKLLAPKAASASNE